ncbi:MAG: acetylxylan esterase [Bacteroidetes bacterium]|nr:acetylxylan esterase [Bacteroidota bacterium]MDA1121247.1 acetylxylan esterase [Bacteroidota bacterium]
MRFLTFLILISLTVVHKNYGQNKSTQNLNLPELLISQDGKLVKNAKVWSEKRRSEIFHLFENNMYGEVPTDFDSINFDVVNESKMAMNGKALLKEIRIDVFRNGQSITINVVLFVPTQTKVPAPAFLLINHRDKENTDPTRGVKMDFWPAEEVITRGYAVAAFYVGDVAADNKETYHQQVLRLYPEQMQRSNGMKTIGAWGWGASRVMDYFEEDPDIDFSKVAVIGHSRGGKAALWCGAQDERFALTISNDSGCTGAALARRKSGERIADINKNFPHWFCDNYNSFNGKEDDLPVDQHMLIALIAPRAVYVASASDDEHADPKGEFLSMKYAEPIFALFDIDPLPVNEQPQINSPAKSLNLGYHLREGGHGLELYDWQRYMDFADAYFAVKKVR